MELARRRSDLWVVRKHLVDLCRVKDDKPTKFRRTYVQRLATLGIIIVEEHKSHGHNYRLSEYGVSLVVEALKYGK